ncbi:uncharacterized protein FTOL_09137 [Fusarium torulosum]|uniref:EthD domain-containing protein n=1 Tax=Fusarium torulosum TaxID=33205 RepID=A0AAE8MDW8_9HYPO|nr:uncharacterized protein FTOL_09137 [Fusarium torulosum]
MPYIKQIVAVRRSPGLTRQEFFDYHFQVHGRISTGPSPKENPSKYFQIHIEDAAYHQQDPSRGPNANPAWAFSDDITELYFESADHIDRVFKSPWVKEKVGPDGGKFSDFGASLPVTVQETLVPLREGVSSDDFDSPVSSPVAMYFITTKNGSVDGLVSGFASNLQQFAASQVRALVANTPADLPFDATAYFGSVPGRPVFDLVFAIHLVGKEGVQDLRKAQRHFEEAYASQIHLENTWIAFGQRALVFDQDKDIKFDPARQPCL